MSYEKNVRTVVPYVPGEQPNEKDMIKLNTNEFPYPPAKGVKHVLENMDAGSLRLYPDPNVTPLVHALADYYKVDRDQVFVGVGSDDVLAMAFLTFFNSEKPILFPDITYSFYDVWADLYKIPYATKKLDKDFRIVKEDYMEQNGGIIIPNPNAPTGILESVELFEEIIQKNPDSVVIVDEAYIDFGGTSCLSLVDKYENLLVVQTFSKSRAMAGMRIGFAIGNKKLIKYLNDVKFSFNSYTMSRVAIDVGVKSVEDDSYFKESVKKIIDTREWTKKELERLGFSFLDSYSNFIFASHTMPAKEIFEKLKAYKIYVRYFNKERIDNYLRISIGTDEEMKKLIQALEEIIEKKEKED